MWSYVGNKENKQWIWLALDDDSGEVVGAFVGGRDIEGAKGYGFLLTSSVLLNLRLATNGSGGYNLQPYPL